MTRSPSPSRSRSRSKSPKPDQSSSSTLIKNCEQQRKTTTGADSSDNKADKSASSRSRSRSQSPSAKSSKSGRSSRRHRSSRRPKDGGGSGSRSRSRSSSRRRKKRRRHKRRKRSRRSRSRGRSSRKSRRRRRSRSSSASSSSASRSPSPSASSNTTKSIGAIGGHGASGAVRVNTQLAALVAAASPTGLIPTPTHQPYQQHQNPDRMPMNPQQFIQQQQQWQQPIIQPNAQHQTQQFQGHHQNHQTSQILIPAAGVQNNSAHVMGGLIPPKNTHAAMRTGGHNSALQMTRKSRRIFVGNLPSGFMGLSEAVLFEFFTTAARGLGVLTDRPVICVNYKSGGKYCFLEFRSVADATMSLSLFANLQMAGQTLKLQRPSDYVQPPPEMTQFVAP